MATNRHAERQPDSVAGAHLARVATSGCARHPHIAALIEATGPNAARDLADAVHLLCSIHGRHPGMIEIALSLCPKGPAQAWLVRAAEGFERERLYLVRLTAAVGPMPSTPGAAETENVLSSQRNALETLARSERKGCALGAATALVGDWWPIRRMLDRAAMRAGLDCPAPSLPDEASIVEVIGASSEGVASDRALAFGAEQLLLQHRGLFDLLEVRASARGD